VPRVFIEPLGDAAGCFDRGAWVANQRPGQQRLDRPPFGSSKPGGLVRSRRDGDGRFPEVPTQVPGAAIDLARRAFGVYLHEKGYATAQLALRLRRHRLIAHRRPRARSDSH
jgi:hypothetical protein